MKFLDNLRIRTRLALGFGALMLLLGLMALAAAVAQLQSHGALGQLVQDRYPRIKLAADLNDSAFQVALSVRNIALISGDNREADLVTMRDLRRALGDDTQALAARVTDDAMRPRMDELARSMAAYLQALDAFLAVAATADAAEIQARLQGELGQRELALGVALAGFTRWEEKAMERSGREVMADGQRLQALGLLALALGLVLGGTAAVLVTRSVTCPLQQAVAALKAVEAGDLSVQLNSERGDELGTMLRALDHTVLALRGLIGRVNEGVHAVSSASAQIAESNQDLSARTERQAGELQQTAGSMASFKDSLQQSTEHAQSANLLAVEATEAAVNGGGLVEQAVVTMNAVSTSSHRIADIIGVIDGIAFQTNILALNAAVEAARAGDQGRGFAVVASEVRSLAQRSATAAREIKTLISSSVEQVDTGARQVREAGEAMTTIVEKVHQVSLLIGEISASAMEQSEGIAGVSEAVTRMDEVTQQNAALVQQSAAAAGSLRDQAGALSQAVQQFTLAPG